MTGIQYLGLMTFGIVFGALFAKLLPLIGFALRPCFRSPRLFKWVMWGISLFLGFAAGTLGILLIQL